MSADILIADDHAVVREGVKRILAAHFPDARVAEAADGRDALKLLQERRISLGLVDQNLPGKNGLELITEAKRLGIRTPLLLFTAFPEQQYAIRAIRSGATGFLSKDSDSEEILKAIRTVLNGQRYIPLSVAEAMASHLGDAAQPHTSLSDRELDVLKRLALGHSVTEISKTLQISVKTVSTYRTRVLEKLNLATNADLVAYAQSHGLS